MTALDIDLDYDLPWSRLFTLAASRIVEAEGSLRILGHLHRDVDPLMFGDAILEDPLDQVHSWVPFWSLPRSAGQLSTEDQGKHTLGTTRATRYYHHPGRWTSRACNGKARYQGGTCVHISRFAQPHYHQTG
jgi:hypothetical protein